MYFIISLLLYSGADIVVDNSSYYIFLAGLGISVLVSSFIIRNAYNNEDDDDENSYLVMPQTPCCEKFFAIAI